MKKILFGLLLGLFALTFTTVTAANNYWMNETYAVGSSNFYETECISTHIGFLVQDGWYRDESGRKVISSASVNYTRYDFCQGIPLLNANGSVPISKLTFHTYGNLAAATLNTTIPVVDTLTNQSQTLVVRMNWIANGPQERTRNNYHSHDGGILLISHSVSIIQPATLVGSIVAKGKNLIAGQAVTGDMGRGSEIHISIGH